jgi:hypothetical protein
MRSPAVLSACAEASAIICLALLISPSETAQLLCLASFTSFSTLALASLGTPRPLMAPPRAGPCLGRGLLNLSCWSPFLWASQAVPSRSQAVLVHHLIVERSD